MQISFASNKLAKAFNSERELKREYGSDRAKAIMKRMAMFKAAACLAEVPSQKPERCHQLKGNRKYQFGVDINHPFRIVFMPEGQIPFTADGGVDLKKV